MAQKRQTKLSTKEKLSISQAAKQTERLGDLGRMVDANLATKPNECWRTLTMEHKEIILFRLQAGDTVKHVCDQLGISTGVVYMARHHDEEFKEEYHKARKAGSDALVDALRDIHLDTSLSDARAKLASDNYKWLAARMNRDEWQEHQKVDHNVTVQAPVIPDWFAGAITVQASDIDPEVDPDAVEDDPENPTE